MSILNRKKNIYLILAFFLFVFTFIFPHLISKLGFGDRIIYTSFFRSLLNVFRLLLIYGALIQIFPKLNFFKSEIWRIPIILSFVIIAIQYIKIIIYFFYNSFFNSFLFSVLQIIILITTIIFIGKKYKIIYFYLIIALLTIEIYSRYFYNSPNNSSDFSKISKAENFKFPTKKVEIQKNTATELKYYDYFLFAPYPHKDNQMYITDYYSARNVPESMPLGKGELIIWTFGGSTMLNIETSDSLSIANQISKNLIKENIKPTVINFGVWSFQSSLECIKFQALLKQVEENQKPNIVIFYDGYNDAGFTYWFGAGKTSINHSNKIKALIEGDYNRLWLYSFFKQMCRFSKFWEYFVEPKINTEVSLFGGYSKKNVIPNTENLLKGVKIYESNTRIIRAICKEFNITPFFILQPMIYTKKNLTNFEKQIIKNSLDTSSINKMKYFYCLTKETMSKYPDFYDLSNILDSSKHNDFYDLGHTGPYTGISIGKAIADTLIQHIKYKN